MLFICGGSMKKFLPLVMCLLATVLISACSQSDSKVDGLSSIEIVLPDGPALEREIETENKQTIYNFLLTVSNEASENDSVSITGKSGEKLKVEVKPGIYFVKLQAFALEDTELAYVLYEASKEHVEVFAGKVTKVSLELSKIISETEKENVEVSVFDPVNISITGKQVLEVDDFDKEYSTLKIPGASYVWSWDGEEVSNETDETCVINTSKLEYLETGSHTLKVEINYNGVLGEAKKEVSILPVFEILYNKTTETNYSKEPEWVLEELNNSYSDKIKGSSPLTAFCFDEDLSFYSAEYSEASAENSEGTHIISRHSISPISGYETRSEVCSFTLTEKYISRMTTDGQNIYFISQTHNGSYRYYNVYFHPDNDKNNLYMVSEKNQTPVNIDVSNIFDICTAVGYENGYLYVAGYSAGESKSKEFTDSSGIKLSGNVYDYTYKIIKFPVSDIPGSIMEADTVYSYQDHDVFIDPLHVHDFAIENGMNFSGKVSVVSLITDLVVKNDCVYAFRTNFRNVEGGTMYKDFYSFTALYKDKDSSSFTEIKIPAQVQETWLSSGYKQSFSIFPLRIMAVRRRKIYFAQANGREDYVDTNNKTYFRCIDFEKYNADNPDSFNDVVETYGDSEYGYQFDNIDLGSGNLLVTSHLYQIGESAYEEPVPSN